MSSQYSYTSFLYDKDAAATKIYTLSLHDALPISPGPAQVVVEVCLAGETGEPHEGVLTRADRQRSEEHTSELQSHVNLVCRLLLEKKNYDRKPLNLDALTALSNYRYININNFTMS